MALGAFSMLGEGGKARRPISKRMGRMPAEADVAYVMKLYKAATVEWEQFRSIHLEAYDYALPNRQIFVNDTPGARKTDKVFNSAAVKATQRLAGRLQQAIVPPFRQWIRLEPGAEIDPEMKLEAQAFLDKQTEIMFEAIDNSNLATTMHESLLDLCIGTGAIMLQDGGLSNPLEFTSVPLFELKPIEGPTGNVETVFRDRPVRAGDVLRVWPRMREVLKPGDPILNDIENAPQKLLRFIEGVIERPSHGNYMYVVMQTAASEAYGASGTAAGRERALITEEIEDNPFIIFRWSKLAGETYGRGPIFDVLPDVRTVNELTRFTLQNAQMAVAPPILSEEGGILNPATFAYNPGGINYVGALGSIDTLKTDYRFDVSNLIVEQMEMSIRKGMHVESLPPPESGIRSATEIMVRQQDLAEDIGAAFGRLQHELLEKLTRRIVRILQRHGTMQPFRVDGKEVDTKYVGPLAESQERESVLAFSQFWEIAASISPQVAMLGVKVEDVPQYLGDKFNIPHALLRSPAEREKMQQEVGQVLGEQQQAEAAQGDQGGPNTGALPSTR